LGLLPAAAIVFALARSQWRHGVARRRIAALTLCRAVVAATLLFLLSRPVYVQSDHDSPARDAVVLLVDRSESMSLDDGAQARYQAAVAFARDPLLEALKSADLKPRALLFADDAAPANGDQIAGAKADGRATNLARAIVRAVGLADQPPLAVIALTDGAATEHGDNARATAALIENRVPFVGIGFGSETGVRLLAVHHVLAPVSAAPKQSFVVSARLETTGPGQMPAFELILLRDGQFAQRKAVRAGPSPRIWLESFTIVEEREGTHEYTVQLMPPTDPGLHCINRQATATVRISGERELRVLFAQGLLTWDYKFVRLALAGDPSIRMTGLSRTSDNRYYHQDIETVGELAGGFPSTIEAFAPFQVVVISSMKASDLSPVQQDLLARFVGEFGGAVLMIGGAATFDASWQQSRLEELLPVRFSAVPSAATVQPFRIQLTDEALEHRVFQIADPGANRSIWAKLPTFTGFAAVDTVKPGAQVWAVHPSSTGASGNRPLFAIQRYGAGQSAVLCVENLWRWRLAKECDPRHFDRFWQQLFRFLGEGTRETISIRFADQELRPGSDVRVFLERQPSAKPASDAPTTCVVGFTRAGTSVAGEQKIELAIGRPIEVAFHAAEPGNYTISVTDVRRVILASRTIEIREVNVELANAARDMESLRQWAGLSGGFALKAEDCDDAESLVAKLREHERESRRKQPQRLPAGINAWTFLALLGCLSAEWLLRKRWGLT
jgi:uncharacterized membrane protein